MRWWLQTDTTLFSVDNSVAKGLDFSTLPPDVWMVQWVDGRGEIEHQDEDGNNLNGLRETFIDVIPYCPFFQQFMRLLPGLLLPQAKKIQIELIVEVFDSNRQAPFHYPVAAGDYWWDATDATLMSSTVAAIQNVTASLNNVIAQLNAVVSALNSNFIGVINQNAGYGNVLVAQINATVSQIGSYIVDPHNNTLNTFVSIGDALVAYINNTLLGAGASGGVSINSGLNLVYKPAAGLGSDIASTGISWANPYSASYVAAVGPGTFSTVSPIPYTNIPPVSVANAQWIPIGATAPVTVTPAEQAGIMNGIAARTNALSIKKNTKVGEVNALTDIDDVIDYDVTVGW